MSKLSLKVLLGVFALMFSASESYSFPIECTNVNPTPLYNTFVSHKAAESWLPKKVILKKSSIDYFGNQRNRSSMENNWTFFVYKRQIKAKYIPHDKKLKVQFTSGGAYKMHAPVYYNKCVDKSRSTKKTTTASTTSKASNQNKLKSTFMKKTSTDRKNIQSALSELGLYTSSIDGLYGKGTEAALKAYNKEYLGNPDLRKQINALALLKDILTPQVVEFEEASANKPSKTITSGSDDTIQLKNYYQELDLKSRKKIQAKLAKLLYYNKYDGIDGLWREELEKGLIQYARANALMSASPDKLIASLNVKVEKTAAVEQPETEPTPKLDIAQVKASYDVKDYTKAFADAQVLAVQGDPEAQLLLGKMFADGRGTLQVSTVAHMWFNIASMGGIDEAYEERKTITAQMTPSAVEEAQKMAMKCIQSTYADCGLTVKPVAVKQPKPVEKTYISSGSQVEAWFKDETQLKRKQLHYALKKLGVYNSSVDGLWGGNTSRAFTRYINKYKRDAENVDEIFSSILSNVKVPSSFSTSKNTNSSNSSSNKSSKSGLTAIISNPSVAANQAMAICQPKAEIQAQNEYERRKTRGSGKITCKTTNDIMGWGSDTECKQSSGGGFPGLIPLLLEIDPASVAERAAKDRYKNALNSCLAEYGWKK